MADAHDIATRITTALEKGRVLHNPDIIAEVEVVGRITNILREANPRFRLNPLHIVQKLSKAGLVKNEKDEKDEAMEILKGLFSAIKAEGGVKEAHPEDKSESFQDDRESLYLEPVVEPEEPTQVDPEPTITTALFAIEDGIPLPSGRAFGSREKKYPYETLPVAQGKPDDKSFFIPNGNLKSLKTYCSKKGTQLGKKFTARRDEKDGVSGVRIWRTL